MVDSVAGTTRDPVDELIELGGTTWRFVDTAGIRRRFRESQGADYYATCAPSPRSTGPRSRSCSSTRASRSPSRTCASCPWSTEAGRALVIAYNKWDLTDIERREYLENEIERQLYHVAGRPG